MNNDESTYDIGYGKPPEHSRFKKGESGNPKGRPKGALSFAHLFRRATAEKIWIVQDGKRRQMSKLDAAITQLVNKAVKGDLRSMQLVLPLMPLLEDPAAATPGMTSDAEKEAMQVLYARMAVPSATPVEPAVRMVKGPPLAPAKKTLPMKTSPQALRKLREQNND